MIIKFILNIALIISGIYVFYRLQYHFRKGVKNPLLFQSLMMTVLAVLSLMVPLHIGDVTLSLYYIPIILLFLHNKIPYKILSIVIVFLFYHFLFQYDLVQFMIFLVLMVVYQLIVPFIKTPKTSIIILSSGLFTVVYLILLYIFVTPINDKTLIAFFLSSLCATIFILLVYEDINRTFNFFIDKEKYKYYDRLTKLGNVKMFDRFIDKMFKEEENVSILLIDIDNFKFFNDINGYDSGDELIKQVARLLKNHLPTGGEIFRSTGEEFSMVIPNLSFDQTVRLGEAIRYTVEHTKFHIDDTHVVNMTVSIGIGYKSTQTMLKKDVIRQADNMLFAAKKQGQNRIMFAPVG